MIHVDRLRHSLRTSKEVATTSDLHLPTPKIPIQNHPTNTPGRNPGKNPTTCLPTPRLITVMALAPSSEARENQRSASSVASGVTKLVTASSLLSASTSVLAKTAGCKTSQLNQNQPKSAKWPLPTSRTSSPPCLPPTARSCLKHSTKPTALRILAITCSDT